MDSDTEYEAILKTKGDKHYFYIEELQIIAAGDTIEAAHHELLRKKNELIKEFDEAGSLIKLPRPSSNLNQDKGRAVRETGLFAIKALILGFIVVLMISFAGNKVSQGLSAKTLSFKSFLRDTPAKVARGLEQQLDNMDKGDTTPERIEAIRKNLKNLVMQFRPLAEELWPLFPNYRKVTPEVEGEE